MLFVTLLKSLPGKYTEAIRLMKNPKIQDGIVIKHFMGVFGEFDVVIVYEAPTEEKAAEFVVQFGNVADPKTMVAFPAEKLKWTK
jgi:uncharacterized protein with GYD domain